MRFFLAILMAAVCAGETRLGSPLTLKKATAIDQLSSQPAKFVGKIVQVKGTARDVCRNMGCWMEIADPVSGKAVRIKVEDGAIVFPKEAIGKQVVAEGKFVKLELSPEQAAAQARHEAEENGRKFDPRSANSARTVYQIQGTGAVVLD